MYISVTIVSLDHPISLIILLIMMILDITDPTSFVVRTLVNKVLHNINTVLERAIPVRNWSAILLAQ